MTILWIIFTLIIISVILAIIIINLSMEILIENKKAIKYIKTRINKK